MAGGTHFTVLVNYTDGNLEERYFADPGELTPFENTYSEVGTHTIEVTASNETKYQKLSVTADIDIAIADLMVNAVTSEWGQPVKLCATVTAGSRITINITRGDGIGEEHYFANYMLFPSCFEYTYASVATYDVIIRAENSLGYIRSVLYAIQNFDVGPLLIYHAYGDALSLGWSFGIGTNVTVTTKLDGSDITQTPLVDFPKEGQLLYPLSIGIGSHAIEVTAQNCLSQETVNIKLMVEEKIQSEVRCSKEYAMPAPDSFDITIDSTAGSYIYYTIDYGDESKPDDIFQMHSDRGVHSQQVPAVQYASTGYYQINVKMENNVSAQWQMCDIGIENPVVDIAIAAVNSANTTVPVQFTITQNSGQPPTSPKAKWNFGTGNSTEIRGLEMSTATPYVTKHLYDVIRQYYIDVTVYNNISSIPLTTEAKVGMDVSGLTIERAAGQIVAKEELVFTLKVASGSALSYVIDYGDGNTSLPIPRTYSGELDDTTEVTYSYLDPGSKTVVVTAINLFGSDQASLNIDVVEAISGQDIQLEHVYHITDEVITFRVTVEGGSAVTSTITYDDGSATEQLQHLMLDASKSPVVFTKAYSVAGSYSPSVSFSNCLGTVTKVVPMLVIQVPLVAIELEANTDPAAVPGNVTYSVRNAAALPNPTDPFCQWIFADGETLTTDAAQLMAGSEHTVSHYYDGQLTGIAPTSLNCSNVISYAMIELTVTLQRVIDTVTLTASSEALPVNSMAHFQVKCLAGSHVQFVMTYGDGSVDTIPHHDQLNSTSPYNLTHVYLFPQNYTTSIRAENDVSSQTTPLQIAIEVPIVSVTIIPDKTYVSFPTGKASFKAIIPTDEQPTNVFCEWNYGDGTPLESTYSSVVQPSDVISKSHTYSEDAVEQVNVTVTCSNIVSSVSAAVKLDFLRDISGLTISAVDEAYATSVSAHFQASVEQGANVLYKVEFGDGFADEQTVNGTAVGQVVDFHHKYTRPKNYTVEITAINEVYEKLAETYVIVQNMFNIEDMLLTYLNVITCTDNITLTLDVVDGKPVPSNVHVVASCNDSQDIDMHVDEWPLTIQFDEDILGEVTVALRCSNMISQDNMSATIKIEEVIGEIVFEAPSEVILGNLTTIRLVAQQGSHLTVDVEFGDSETDQQISYTNQKAFEFTHTYANPGEYIVTATLSNQVSAATARSSVIVVQVDLETVELDLPSVRAVQDGAVTGRILPANVFDNHTRITVKCDSGVSDADADVFNGDTFTCLYTEVGRYELQVTVTNLVMSKDFVRTLDVEERITNVKFTVEESGATVSGQTSFSSNVPLKFTASVATGTDIIYTWLLNEHDTQATLRNLLEYSYTITGTFYVKVMASNAVNNATASKTITVSNPVDIKAIHYSDQAIIYEPSVINIELSEEITPICYHFQIRNENTGTERTYWKGTSSNYCQKDSDFVDSTFDQITASKLLSVTERFTELGNHVLELKVFAQEKDMTLVARILVKDIPCDIPIVEMRGKGSTFQNPLIVTKSSELRVTSSLFYTKIECNVTDKLQITWNMSRYNGDDFVEINLAAVDMKPIIGGFMVQPLSLNYGTYRIRVIIQMYGLPEKVNGADVFYRIVETPLVAKIMEGTNLLIGHGQSLTIDGITNSYDPDEDLDKKSELRITWACMKESESVRFVWETAPTIPLPFTGMSLHFNVNQFLLLCLVHHSLIVW